MFHGPVLLRMPKIINLSDKSHSITVLSGRKHKLNLRCNDITLQQFDCCKYLGIVIDNHVKWERHITDITKRVSFNNARMLRSILPRCVIIKIFDVTSIPIIDYASTVWGYVSTAFGNIMKRLENAAARVMIIWQL